MMLGILAETIQRVEAMHPEIPESERALLRVAQGVMLGLLNHPSQRDEAFAERDAALTQVRVLTKQVEKLTAALKKARQTRTSAIHRRRKR